MRAFVIVLFVATATLGFDLDPEMKKYADECAKENKVDLSVFKAGEKPDPEIFKNKEYKCFGKCISMKAGLCTKDGEPNVEKIKEIFKPSDEAIEHLKTCSEENKQEDACERVFQIHECIMKNVKGE